jgi:hypothetical protein
LAHCSADINDTGNDNLGAAALLAEIEALRHRLAALEREARLSHSAAARRRRREALRRPLPPKQIDATAREPDMAGRIARRRALGLGVLASLFACIGRGAARAAETDALTIGADGVAHFNGTRNLFTDQENAGNLRVGGVYGVPGIYSEKGAVFVGSQNGNVWLGGKVGVGKKEPAQSLDVSGTVAADNIDVAGAVTAGGQFVGKGDAVLHKGLTLTGNLTAQKTAGANTIDIQRAKRDNDHPTGLALYVTAESAEDGGGIEFRHSNASQGIGFGYNTIYATGSNADQPLVLKARGNGTVQIGAAGGPNLVVPGGEEPLRMLRGIVNHDGTRFGGGEGFKTSRAGQGLYDIVFDKPFSSVPAASATQIYGFASTTLHVPATNTGGNTRDNAVITHLTADRMRVKTGNGNGDAEDRVFSFIVVGPR